MAVIRGIYTAAAGMIADSMETDQIGANLANVSTPGYKAIGTIQGTFPSMLVERLAAGGGATLGALGLGVRVDDTPIDWSEGVITTSDNPLAAAIQGPGLFAVQTPAGVEYTRNGDFTENGNGALVTRTGDAVLGAGGTPITLPSGAASIGNGGVIRVGGRVVGRLDVVQPANLGSLESVGGGLYRTVKGPPPAPVANPAVVGGELEGSNVDATAQMVAMLAASRSYATNAQALQASNTALGWAISDVGKLA